MNYSDLSDFEINKLVAESLGRFEFVSDHNIEGGSAVLCDSLRTCDEYDFCNNPSDAWPIIVENEIGLNPQSMSSLWLADVNGESKHGYSKMDKNPLRAAMIVYLMRKEKAA